MTATIEPASQLHRVDPAVSRSTSPESGFEAALLGSVGTAIGSLAAIPTAAVGSGSASPAPGKRRDDEKEIVKRARAMSDPAAIAAGELVTHGAPKATVQAAEAAQVTSDPNAAPPRGRSASTASPQPGSGEGGHHAGLASTSASRSGAVRPAPPSAEGDSAGSADAGSKRPASRVRGEGGDGRSATSKASINAQTKPLDAGQALARLAQALNRAVDRPAAAPGAGRSPLRVETASPAQRSAAAKHAAPQSNIGRAQQAQDDFAAQLHRGFSAVLRQNGGSLTLRMQPEALGDLTIRMDRQPGQVAADFEVGSDQARQLLSDHMTSLRSALEAQGLSVDKLTVSVSDRPTPEALANRAEPGTSGGADSHEGGGPSGRGGRSGVEHPLVMSARSAQVDDVVSAPGDGSDVHMGGAQSVRLVLDAVA